jgi:hypothetical protein
MYKLAIALSALLVLVPTTAQAQTSRGAVLQYAEYVHNMNFIGGDATIKACHRKDSRLVVCSALLTGVPAKSTGLPTEPLDCTLVAYAYRRRSGAQHADVAAPLDCVPSSSK